MTPLANATREIIDHILDHREHLARPDRYPLTIWASRLNEIATQLDTLTIEYRWVHPEGTTTRWFPDKSINFDADPTGAELETRLVTQPQKTSTTQ